MKKAHNGIQYPNMKLFQEFTKYIGCCQQIGIPQDTPGQLIRLNDPHEDAYTTGAPVTVLEKGVYGYANGNVWEFLTRTEPGW